MTEAIAGFEARWANLHPDAQELLGGTRSPLSIEPTIQLGAPQSPDAGSKWANLHPDAQELLGAKPSASPVITPEQINRLPETTSTAPQSTDDASKWERLHLHPDVQALLGGTQVASLATDKMRLSPVDRPTIVIPEAWKDTGKSAARKLGFAAAVWAGVILSFVGVAEFSHDKTPPTVAAEVAQTPVTEAPSVTVAPPATAKAPVLAPVEAPAPVTAPTTEQVSTFSPKPNQGIGVFTSPKALCNQKIIFGEYSEVQDTKHIVGTGAGYIDQKIPAPTPEVSCVERDARKAQREGDTHTDFIGRVERVRNGRYSAQNPTADGSSIGPGNPSGHANYYVAFGGHATSVQGEGIYTSPIPGNEGNAVVSGHGSTWGAGFGDIALMQAGDTGEFNRFDGHNYQYEVISSEVVRADQLDAIYNYKNDNYKATITLYNCTGSLNGDPGTGDEYRLVVRVGLRWVSSNS